MSTFVYIDYGPSPDIATELKYSLATLMAEYSGREPEVVIYTDKPDVYAGLRARVNLRPFGGDFERWSRGGSYAHRVKPCVLIDALETFDDDCALVDSDTFVRPGFAAAFAAATWAGGVAMDVFEKADPLPAAAGFAADLPTLGRYTYEGAASRMYNSGLVAARRRHIPLLKDAVALIDAFREAGHDPLNIEQLALSEAFRRGDESIAEMRPWFEHYHRPSQKRYMRPRIATLFERLGEWRPVRPALEPSKLRVRSARIVAKLLGKD